MAKKTTDTKNDFDDTLGGASAERAVRALEQAGSRSVELVDEWLRRGNAAAIAEAAEHAQGAARKAARRAINVLKSRGIAIPERTGRVASLTGPRADEIKEAWMLAPDSSGTLLVVLTARAPASRYRAAFVVLNDEHGIFRVDVGEPTQSQLKDAMAKMLPGAQYKPVRVPVEWVRHRIERAKRRHAEVGTPLPLGLGTAQDLLEPSPSSAPGHPFDDEGLELSEDDARDMALESGKLHVLPEFRGWFPPQQAMDEMLGALGQALPQGGEQPDPEAMNKLVEEQVRAATDRFFSPERRSALVRAMKDSALSVLAREGEVRALEVVAAIKAIETAGLITNPPQDVPFLRGFFEKALSVLLAQSGGRLRVPVPYRPLVDTPSSADAGSVTES